MATAGNNLPLRRTFSPDPIGQSARLFRFHSKELTSDVSVPTLVGAVASAQGAPLGSTEFDVLTLALRRFQQDGAPADNVYRSKMRPLVRDLYGYHGGHTYEIVSRALENLFGVEVTLPSFDGDTGTFNTRALTKARLITQLVIVAGEEITYAPERETVWSAIGRLNRPDQVTLKIEFASWLGNAVRADQGRELDYEVQRALRGAAKACWVLLEASAFTPCPDSPNEEELTLLLERETYAALGLNSRRLTDCRAELEDKLNRIIRADPSYVEYEFRPAEHDRRRRILRVRRATGALRQSRLRRALLQQANTPSGRNQTA